MEPTSNISSRRAHHHITRAIAPTTLAARGDSRVPVATIAIQTRKHREHARSMVVQAMVLDPPVPGQHVRPDTAQRVQPVQAIARRIVGATPVVRVPR
ncbi:hypothetical protein KDAU_35500 [Dictyobacter aurantiacus]|uniref:Uncharacterized protein n=1 Tax=Dictyobacter aurantiacus TaxID=1936993 RepID=A0A401ZH64_9CHLR|nr:hypothetical protein KDAU_35500 [Dictyobacter aurantiacus]